MNPFCSFQSSSSSSSSSSSGSSGSSSGSGSDSGAEEEGPSASAGARQSGGGGGRFAASLKELRRKQAHPARLHKEIWFNEVSLPSRVLSC